VDAGRAEPGAEGALAAQRTVLYCVLPAALAPKLHDSLREHFAELPDVEVVVERRGRERRAGEGRRASDVGPISGPERRVIRNPDGRRVADRRAPVEPLAPEEAPELPRRARHYAEQLVWLRRAEPSGVQLEDADSARLVTRVQAGDSELFGTLYSRYFDRVYASLKLALRDPHEAEDATQEVFMRAFEALPSYELRGVPFRAWLFRIARNYALKHLRKMGRIEPEDPAVLARMIEQNGEHAEIDDDAMAWITDQDLSVLVVQLPESQHQVLVLRYLLGFNMVEIAAIVGASSDAVRQTHQRAIVFLRERLIALGRGPSDAPEQPKDDEGMSALFRPVWVLRARRFALFK